MIILEIYIIKFGFEFFFGDKILYECIVVLFFIRNIYIYFYFFLLKF